MTETARTIGLMVQRTNRYGTEYIEATAMSREGDQEYPIGTPSWYAHEGKPFVEGLSIRGHVSIGWHEAPEVRVLNSQPAYYDLHCVEYGHAKAMGAMLARIAKQIERDAAYEDGDRFLSFARAIGAQWVCMPRKGIVNGGEWRNSRWAWYGLTDGRNAYRYLIREVVREEEERQAARRKPTEPVGERATA